MMSARTELHVKNARPGAGLVLRPRGALEGDTCSELRQQLGTAFAAGITSVVVDLAAVSSIDRTGIGVLAGAWRHLGKRGGGLAVTHASAAVATALRINGLGDLLQIVSAPALRVLPGEGAGPAALGRSRPLSVVRTEGLKQPS
jgi:anti-sigma B factor antagonist